MIFLENAVRLTPAELNTVRTAAALNGFAHNRIGNRDELLQALLDGLPRARQDELLAFLEDADPTSEKP